MSGLGLAEAVLGTRYSEGEQTFQTLSSQMEVRSFWRLKQRPGGYLLGDEQTLKTALSAAYLEADIDVRVGTCWGSSRFSVLSSQGKHDHFGHSSRWERGGTCSTVNRAVKQR